MSDDQQIHWRARENSSLHEPTPTPWPVSYAATMFIGNERGTIAPLMVRIRRNYWSRGIKIQSATESSIPKHRHATNMRGSFAIGFGLTNAVGSSRQRGSQADHLAGIPLQATSTPRAYEQNLENNTAILRYDRGIKNGARLVQRAKNIRDQ